MIKISRYILVITAVIGFAIALPKLYWIAFSKPVRTPFIMYSCVENDFMILRSVNKKVIRADRNGNVYTREEYEQKLPLLYTRQLLMSKTMPDSIYDIKMDPKSINIHRSSLRVKPKDLFSPKPQLFPLFESQSGRANLPMPMDFFRIKKTMEFVDAKQNTINKEKSRIFTLELEKKRFEFPAKSINGIPTTHKSCDEGYFVIDSKDQLFHIKMVHGKPYIVRIELPRHLKFKHIRCVDFKDKKFYAYLFSTKNKLYILKQDNYELVQFPIENIDPAKSSIRIFGNLFYYNVIVTGEDFTKNYAISAKNYKIIDEYEEKWSPQLKRNVGKVFQFLFPGQIRIKKPDTHFIKFYTEVNKSFYWVVFSILLIAIQFIILKKRRLKTSKHIIDFFIIAFFGIFGFLAVNIFPNKFFD